MSLFNDYCPKRWSDLFGQDSGRIKVRSIISRPNFKSGAILLTGPSGSGKSSMANVLACELHACPHYAVRDIPAAKCTLAALEEMEQWLWTCAPSGGWKLVVVNECHEMTSGAQGFMLGLLERLPAKRLIVATSTESAPFSPILASRWLKIKLETPDEQAAFDCVSAIALAEGIACEALLQLVDLLDDVSGKANPYNIGRVARKPRPDNYRGTVNTD